MNKKKNIFIILFLIVILSYNLYGGEWIQKIETDKARYEPATAVKFKILLNKNIENQKLSIKYYHLEKEIGSSDININNKLTIQWNWNPPAADFKGYLVKIYLKQSETLLEESSIAVDVSSNWNRFPRYGFLSSFDQMRSSSIGENISKLNRYHINGLQYYDWQYKHHQPIKGSVNSPASSWVDIANRPVSFNTIREYIDTARAYNIKSMAYNLLYGAYSDAWIDGVSNDWRMYVNSSATSPDFHDLPANWASDIYLIDPTNSDWQDFIIKGMGEAILALKFDGWHSDQLGDRGIRYNNKGSIVNVTGGFKSLLTKAKTKLNCELVMNAVNQYGQKELSQTPLNFLYTEVWEPNTTYDKLGQLILDNDNYTNGQLKTVLAAYLHKAASSTKGTFNTSAVLYANAVIFAFGGSHLELGEHMLCSEYFPVNNLSISSELEEKLITYYDFLVAYQNLLRDGGNVVSEQLKTTLTNLPFYMWSRTYAVWNFTRAVGNRKIIHLLNFADASTLDWRDNSKTQKEPLEKTNIPVYFETTQQVYNVWIASPDYNNGLPQHLNYNQTADRISFTIPKLKYWDMVVIDFDPTSTGVKNTHDIKVNFGLYLEQNFPNPFNPKTTIKYSIPSDRFVQLKVYDLLGREVTTLVNEQKQPGIYSLSFDGSSLTSGVYLYQLKAGKNIDTKKFILIK